MTQTHLLPPFTAVRMVWARTGHFPKDEHSQLSAVITEAALKDIKELARKDPKEEAYVFSTIATMDASLRSLDTIYKGRELNFKENEKLREVHLDTIKENLDFGNKAKDFLKSLPTMTIGSAGGVTLAQALKIPNHYLWAIGFGLAALGYLVNVGIVRMMRKRSQMLYVKEDYDRDIYYEHYVIRVVTTLSSLYLDIDRIHKNVFGEFYPVEMDTKEIVDDMLKGVRPTFCKYIQKHMAEKKIKPKIWPVCETGIEEAVKKCPYWEG